MFLGMLLLITSLVLLFRLLLIITGMHKGPVLEIYEKYGDEEPVFYPWPQLLLWISLGIIALGMMSDGRIRALNVATVMGFVMLSASWGLFNFQGHVKTFMDHRALPIVPTWLGRLNENTTRYERRRIAYMWLRLPIRTRLIYNSSDQLFFQWADLVIMATVRES